MGNFIQALSGHFQEVIEAHVAGAIVVDEGLSWIKVSSRDKVVIELDCMEVFIALGGMGFALLELV